MPRRQRLVLIVALVLLGAAALRDFARLGDALPWNRLYDFQDFYCAGAALDARADPYRYEPLHTCEHRVNTSAAYRADPRRAVPAPLPPYDFPAFMLAARLSFPVARTIDALAIIAAVGVAIGGMLRLGVPLDLAAAALILPGGYLLLDAGQVVPFALAAIVVCGLALARGRDAPAGALAALTLVEPHLGLPVCAAVFLLAPKSRMALVGTAAFLAIVGQLTVGTAGAIEYLTRVLPAQAGAESAYVYQFSLTYLLRWLGAPAGAALIAGNISYAALALFGIWLGGRLARTLNRRELVAFLPAACAVCGGAYVHMVDLAAAIPAALVLATSLRGNLRAPAGIALCLLAVPWIAVWIAKKLFLSSLVAVAIILVRLQLGAAVGIGTFAAIAAAIYAFELWPPAPFSVVTSAYLRANDLAQDAWRAYVAQLAATSPGWLAIKLPTWGALVALLATAFCALRARGVRSHT